MHFAERRWKRGSSLSPFPCRTVTVPRSRSTSFTRSRTNSDRRNPAPYCSRAANPYLPPPGFPSSPATLPRPGSTSTPPESLASSASSRFNPLPNSSPPSSSSSINRCVSPFDKTTGTRVPVFRSFTAKTGSSTPHTRLKKNANALSACFCVEYAQSSSSTTDVKNRVAVSTLITFRSSPANLP